jgi:hypothetical protein
VPQAENAKTEVMQTTDTAQITAFLIFDFVNIIFPLFLIFCLTV